MRRVAAVLGTLWVLSCSARPRFDSMVGKSVLPNSAGDPGHPVLHRLNRVEYDNTVHELLGTELRPAEAFPSDDHGFGFDNNAGVLSISPTQFQLYEQAAELLAAEALAPQPAASSTRIVQGEELHSNAGRPRATAFQLSNNGSVVAKFELPAHGKYRVTVRAWGEQAGREAVRMRVTVAQRELLSTEVHDVASAPGTFSREVSLSAGPTPVEVFFLNDAFERKTGRDRNLLVESLSVEGPLDTAADTRARRAHVLVCDPATGQPCLRQILASFAGRAFRRPARPAEVQRLLGLVNAALDDGESVEHGLELALRAVLLSPYFLFRPELDAEPSSPVVRRLNGYEMASRLSYFLWSSMPDEALFRAAETGKLDEAPGLKAEVARMLDDPRSFSLVNDFGGQWLLFRALAEHQVDSTLSVFDDQIRAELGQEVRLFLNEFLHQPWPVQRLLTARFTFVNDHLARFYGLPDRPGASFGKVDLATPERGGLLRAGALLTVTSLPHRSSPVKRGKWVLGQLLCSEPPPPPPGVPQIPHRDFSKATLREILKAHRDKPECAVCHNMLDPIGLALENYDAIGRFRARDHGQAVDAHGTLPNGTVLNGPNDLSQSIASDPRFPACVAEKLYVYALGRGLEPHDEQELERMLKELGAGFSLPGLIAEIAQSNGFRYRRGESPLEGSAP